MKKVKLVNGTSFLVSSGLIIERNRSYSFKLRSGIMTVAKWYVNSIE